MTIFRCRPDFTWEEIEKQPYKAAGDHFRDISRQLLFGHDSGLPFEVRYFEIDPSGHSTLERHRHPHAVIILRGRGEVLVDPEIHEVEPYDLVHVEPMTWHQFRAASDAPLGFLCVVSVERDRPLRPSEEELARLRSDPAVAAFIRA